MKSIIDKFVDGKDKSIIKVVGVGGGGCNAVESLYRRGQEGVTFLVCNTDRLSLNAYSVPFRVGLGDLGAGDDPDAGERAAEEHADDIRKALSDNTEMVFITAGIGGGTGTGASPVVARIAKEMGLLTVGIVTIPFQFEGMNKILKAIKWIEKLEPFVDALIVINNEKLTGLPGYDIVDCFEMADEVLADAASSIADIVIKKGKVNADFNDVRTTLRSGKMAVISTGSGKGERRVTKALEDAMNSTLIYNKDVYKCKRVLLNFYCSRAKALNALEMNEVTEFMQRMPKDVDVKWGLNFDESLDEKMCVTVLAAGQGDVCPEEYVAQYRELEAKRKSKDCQLEMLDDDDFLLGTMTTEISRNRCG